MAVLPMAVPPTAVLRGSRASFLASLGVLAACALSPADAGPLQAESPAGSPAATIDQFVGRYVGTLRIADGPEVSMTLDVEPMASPANRGRHFHWRLRYGEQPVRDYVLRELDRDVGSYEIDEQNGIVLPAVLRFGELVSVFAVGNSMLNVRYRLCTGGVEFALESVGTTAGQDAGNAVRGFSRVAVQRAELRRQ